MICPHCLVAFHDNPQQVYLASDADGEWAVEKQTCPTCKKFTFTLLSAMTANFVVSGNARHFQQLQLPYRTENLVRPKASGRPPCPKEVPEQFRGDYLEACLVWGDSPKAAAALGRRCLQSLLREVAKVKPGNLADEIQQVIDSNTLPSDLSGSIDAVRNLGNFAAHPMKSQHSGEILEVEPGEAEWTLDVLESLFDFYFVRPEKLKRMRDALNRKLKEANKPEMK